MAKIIYVQSKCIQVLCVKQQTLVGWTGQVWGWGGGPCTIPKTRYLRSSRSMKFSDSIATGDILQNAFINILSFRQRCMLERIISTSRWGNWCSEKSPRLPPRASETKTPPCCVSPQLEFFPHPATTMIVLALFTPVDKTPLSLPSHGGHLRGWGYFGRRKSSRSPLVDVPGKKEWKTHCLLGLQFFFFKIHSFYKEFICEYPRI